MKQALEVLSRIVLLGSRKSSEDVHMLAHPGMMGSIDKEVGRLHKHGIVAMSINIFFVSC